MPLSVSLAGKVMDTQRWGDIPFVKRKGQLDPDGHL